MKKLLLALFVLPFFAFVAADWVTVKLDNRAMLDFPSQPQEKEMGGNQVWIQDIDSNGRCMAMVLDFTSYGMDSAKLADEMSKDQAFADFRQGVLGQIEGSKLISEKKGTVEGKLYFEYKIDMGKTDVNALNVMYNRNIFAGTKMYSVSFYEKNNKPRDLERKKFFASFRLRY